MLFTSDDGVLPLVMCMHLDSIYKSHLPQMWNQLWLISILVLQNYLVKSQHVSCARTHTHQTAQVHYLALHIHCTHCTCTLHTHCTCTLHTLYMCTAHTVHVHCTHRTCTLHTPYVHTARTYCTHGLHMVDCYENIVLIANIAIKLLFS